MRDEKIAKRLEKLAAKPVKTLGVCISEEGCDKIKVPIGKDGTWIEKQDYPGQHEAVLEAYQNLRRKDEADEKRKGMASRWVSGTYCPEHLSGYLSGEVYSKPSRQLLQ